MLSSLKKIISLRQNAEIAVSDIPALMMQAHAIAQNIHHGAHLKKKEGLGEEFFQYRNYIIGDRLQDIDWKQSAKTDHIFIKQKELQISRKTFFWCADDKGMKFSSHRKLKTKQEIAQILTLALALLMIRSNEQVGYFGDLKTGHNEKQIQNIGLHLVENSYPHTLPPVQDFSIPRNASFVAIGDFLSPLDDINDTFEQISLRGVRSLIIQVLDPSEINLTFDEGRIHFEGISSNEHEIIDHIASIREEYQKRIYAQIDGLKSLCRKFGWHYFLHITDSPIDDTLESLWQRLEAENLRS